LYPDIEVVGLREGHDDEAKNYRQTKTLLGQHPDLAGIYNIGGGPEGIARALKEAGRQDIVFVGHGLTPETRGLLVDGTL
ncbi:substrate-binding domain-containing protein, partial [Clostridium tyrobutyricum]|uniref:substrate-binding domain-containing protein n=1 Tax=Clostridium tyrobutyricum TaxID=1519 RepID=UPI001C38FFCF